MGEEKVSSKVRLRKMMKKNCFKKKQNKMRL